MVVLPLLLRLLVSTWLLALRMLLLNTLLAAPLLLLLKLRVWLLADANAAAAAGEFAGAANVVVGTSAVAAARYRGSLPPPSPANSSSLTHTSHYTSHPTHTSSTFSQPPSVAPHRQGST